MKVKIKRTLLILMSVVLASPAIAEQADDPTDQYLKLFATPIRSLEADDRPNVLLLMVDDLNIAIGAYLDGTARLQYRTAKTPNIDRLAATGIRFHHAFVQNPVCSPSRASFLSGLRPETTDIHVNRIPWRQKMGQDLRLLPEHFHDQGYFTARVGKIGHNDGEDAISWDVSMFALSREPGVRFHIPGYLPGVDVSEIRDNTWTEGSQFGMTRAQLLRAVGRASGLPLSWRATNESPRMTPDGTTATRVINLMAQNRDKPFFNDLVEYICSSPIIALALSGPNAVQKSRSLIGKTNPLESEPGTIRGDFGLEISRNLIHGSASVEDAEREVNIFFAKDEIINYSKDTDTWVVE